MDGDDAKTSWKKTLFSICLISFCLGTAVKMGFDTTLTTKVAEIVADGLITTSMFVAVTFLAADSVDTSGVLRKLGSRMSRGPIALIAAEPPPPEPVYGTVDPDLAKG